MSVGRFREKLVDSRGKLDVVRGANDEVVMKETYIDKKDNARPKTFVRK